MTDDSPFTDDDATDHAFALQEGREAIERWEERNFLNAVIKDDDVRETFIEQLTTEFERNEKCESPLPPTAATRWSGLRFPSPPSPRDSSS